jgi:hypothetical protein
LLGPFVDAVAVESVPAEEAAAGVLRMRMLASFKVVEADSALLGGDWRSAVAVEDERVPVALWALVDGRHVKVDLFCVCIKYEKKIWQGVSKKLGIKIDCLICVF